MKRKRVLSMVAAAILVVGLAGCGSSQGSETENAGSEKEGYKF